MKKGLLISVLAVVAVLASMFFLKKCEPSEKPAHTDEEARAILDSNFARVADSIRVIQLANAEAIARLISTAAVQQTAMLERLRAAERALSAKGLKMANFVEFQSSTERTWATKWERLIDSLQKQKLPAEAFKFSEINDEWMNALLYELPGDSLGATVTMKNLFNVTQYEQDGKRFAKVDNLNPYTYTEPGASVFELQIPDPSPFSIPANSRKVGFSIGGGVGWLDKKAYPTVNAQLLFFPF